jgi:hypothetical protein
MNKPSTGRARLLLLIPALVLGIVLVAPLLDRLLLPWAFDDPALTDSWVGSLTTATGRQRGLLLELRLPAAEGRSGLVRDWENAPHGELAGQARMCDEQGQVRVYLIDGEPENFRATRLSFHLSPVETPAPEGLTPNWVQGTWNRSNRLDLRVAFHWRNDGASISGPEYSDTMAEAALTLERGGEAEFKTICAHVLQHR